MQLERRRRALIERLGIPPRLRRRPLQVTADADERLRGLVLVDLPDHDSAAVQHREQVDRVLGLVDAVIWVVDPEKYADAMLHERYLRPMAAHAEVMFVVLNQTDRLPGEAADQVLDDLRRLLDEDGIVLGSTASPVRPCRGCPRSPGTGSVNCGSPSPGSCPNAAPRRGGSRRTWTSRRPACGPSTPPAGAPG
ncbi:hypothetical protein SHKM778_80090 [Streptomyces sp. KM77-8]|uniref:G domain-containing protein n=1 Tax=Streptomyces haneummycinicus TaxID=3074435 RepID=A0AAT9HW59_9ACTN